MRGRKHKGNKELSSVCSFTYPPNQTNSTNNKRTVLDILPLEAVLSSSVAALTIARFGAKRHSCLLCLSVS